MPVGGGLAWPEKFLPQQAPPPTVRTPQPWAPPVEIALNVPPNGVACPKKLSPQQAAVPFALNPQLWESPAAIAMKAPPAGAD